MGILKGVCKGNERKASRIRVGSVEALYGGIPGDRHFGEARKQISMLPYEVTKQFFQENGQEIRHGRFGENLVVSGIDWEKIKEGSLFATGEAVLEVVEIGSKWKGMDTFQGDRVCTPMEKLFVFMKVLVPGELKEKNDFYEIEEQELKRRFVTGQVESVKVRKEADGAITKTEMTDIVAKEHVLHMMINESVSRDAICCRMDLKELVVGYLFTEGYIEKIEDLMEVNFAKEDQEVKITIQDDAGNLEQRRKAGLVPTTGGGDLNEVQGIEKNDKRSAPFFPDEEMIMKMSEMLLQENELFQDTGAFHSCILYNQKTMKIYRGTDLGRHNAVDKAIGQALLQGEDVANCVLLTTGRVPTDMIRKAVRSRIPVMLSRGAVTAQAIEQAKMHGILLGGFSRGKGMNFYS